MTARAAAAAQVMDVRYEASTPPLVFDRPSAPAVRARDFAAVDELRVYYAGDFCSARAPGFEAAALSGVDAARHIASALQAETG